VCRSTNKPIDFSKNRLFQCKVVTGDGGLSCARSTAGATCRSRFKSTAHEKCDNRSSGTAPGLGARLRPLLVAQTIAATFPFWTIFSLFQRMMWHMGEAQDISAWTEAAVVGGALFLQCCYWARYCYITVRAPFQSALFAHRLMFASRASFFFSGTLFTLTSSGTYPNSMSLRHWYRALSRS
jgi:hypothetical protein